MRKKPVWKTINPADADFLFGFWIGYLIAREKYDSKNNKRHKSRIFHDKAILSNQNMLKLTLGGEFDLLSPEEILWVAKQVPNDATVKWFDEWLLAISPLLPRIAFLKENGQHAKVICRGRFPYIGVD